MSRVITFGEIMLRLSTEGYQRFSQANSFGAHYGGGEFNVAVSLTNYGIQSEFVTVLPENDLGRTAFMEIRKRGVEAEHIVFQGDRLGLYFLEAGAGARGSKVVYDRANSAMCNISCGLVDWEAIFRSAELFHWSGVTPAISQSAADVCLEALKVAHKMGLMITTDLNYRSKLWKYGKTTQDIMPELLSYSNVILGDLDTAYMMLGMKTKNPDYKDISSLPKLYDEVFRNNPNLKQMATTLRYSVSASHQQIGGILYDREKIHNAEVEEILPVVDRVGSGDAFMGGLIYGLLNHKFTPQQILDFAVAACTLKHTLSGDYNLATLEEVMQVATGNSSGKVSR